MEGGAWKVDGRSSTFYPPPSILHLPFSTQR
jgi:hypothetical protein